MDPSNREKGLFILNGKYFLFIKSLTLFNKQNNIKSHIYEENIKKKSNTFFILDLLC